MPRVFKLFVAIIITTGLATYLILSIFSVKNISLSPQNCLAENDLGVHGKFIFRIDPNSIEARAKERFACLDQLKIAKYYPAKLEVTVVTKIPSVSVADTNLGITPEGLVVASVSSNLTKLFAPQATSLVAGQKVAGSLLFAAELAQILPKTDFAAVMIRILADGEIAVYDSSQRVALFTTAKSAESQVDSLQQVLAAAKIDGAKITKIDLRFAKPVITFK